MDAGIIGRPISRMSWFASGLRANGYLDQKELSEKFNTTTQTVRRWRKLNWIEAGEIEIVSLYSDVGGIKVGDMLIQSRYEAKSTIVTMNVAFADWNSVFPSAACVSAMIDRLTHHATILSFSGESYRLKESGEQQSKRKINTKKAAKK